MVFLAATLPAVAGTKQAGAGHRYVRWGQLLLAADPQVRAGNPIKCNGSEC